MKIVAWIMTADSKTKYSDFIKKHFVFWQSVVYEPQSFVEFDTIWHLEDWVGQKQLKRRRRFSGMRILHPRMNKKARGLSASQDLGRTSGFVGGSGQKSRTSFRDHGEYVPYVRHEPGKTSRKSCLRIHSTYHESKLPDPCFFFAR